MKKSGTINLTHLLEKYGRKVVPKDPNQRAGIGFVITGLICIAIWTVIISIAIVKL